jgi:hypothetical protein
MGAVFDERNASRLGDGCHLRKARPDTKRMLENDGPGARRQPLSNGTGIHVQLSRQEISVDGLELPGLDCKDNHTARHRGENDFIPGHESHGA